MPKLTTAALAAVLSLGLVAVAAEPAAAQTKNEQVRTHRGAGKACAGHEKGSADYKDCMMKQGAKQPNGKRKGQAKATQ
jgi:hypothetical protein